MMEENNGIGCLENGSTSEGKPPNPPRTPSYRQLCSTSDGVLKPCMKTLVRHPSLVSSLLIFFLIF